MTTGQAHGLTGLDDDLSEASVRTTGEELIDVLSDAVDGYEAAIGAVESQDLVERFRAWRGEHEEMLAEVVAVAAQHGISPEEADDGTLGGSLRQSWMRLTGALTAGDGAILEAVEEGQLYALEAFEQAAGEELPEDMEEVVRRHLARLAEIYEQVGSLEA